MQTIDSESIARCFQNPNSNKVLLEYNVRAPEVVVLEIRLTDDK